MKRKIIIISSVIIVLILFYILKNKKTTNEDNPVNKVSDITTNVSSDIIEEVDFQNFEQHNIELKETLKITTGGVYELSGTIENGQIYIDTKDNVKLILNNVNITNESGPAIMIENANVVYIELANNSINYLIDKETYEIDEEGEPNGTIFSKDNLVLTGSGKLIISANYKDGIVSKDNLKIIDGTYEIKSLDDAIRGKDSIVITNGNFEINAGGDAIKSTNDTDTSLGYVLIENGNFNIVANNDGIQAQTDILIKNGVYNIKTGEGSNNSSTTNDNWGSWQGPFDNNQNINKNTDTESAKGLKTTNNIKIEHGEFIIDSSDDAIHSNEYVGIANGNFTINSGDDGIHADNEIIIDDGNVSIEKSYEGIEAENITINNGDIKILATDDGINAAGGNDSSAINGRPGMNNFEGNGNSKIQINGGNIYINSKGDGIDANGNIYMTKGIVIINGPTDSGKGSLDYDKEFRITGGIFIASGSSGMAQSTSNTSTQNSIMINFSNTINSNTLISIKDSNDKEIITYKASKNYQNLVISSPELINGETYTIYTQGTSNNTENNGLYENGGYTNGSEYATFKVNSILTTVGNYKGMNQGMNPGGMPGPMQRR